MKKSTKAFTLVELIIVITILAVLATIAFVSFSSYTASSRDTKRIVTIESIAKGLNIFQTQTGKYPNVDNQSSTGIINSDTLSFVGEVGDNVSKLINISPTPKDPVSGNNFKYATSFDNKYFQVAGTQEKPVADKSILSQAYANSRQAKVLGNYNGLLKYGSKLYNLPSLLYTGSGYLISNETYFIVDKGQNIPYKIMSTDPDNSITTDIILSELTGTSSVTLTGVTLPSTPGELKANINSVVQLLGYPGDKIGQETFGTQYFVASTSASSSSSSSSSGGGGGGGGDCFDPALIGTIGTSGECNGKLIVDSTILNDLVRTGPYTTASGQVVSTYSSNDIFTGQVDSMNGLFGYNDPTRGEPGILYDITGWNVSNVTDMWGMFERTNFNQDISGWDVSKVIYMSDMFLGTFNFNQNIGGWNVGNVEEMSAMFAASQFNQNIGGWDVSKVTDMSRMFSSSPFNQNIGGWNVSNVTNMWGMFNGVTNFNQDISGWDVGNVTTMMNMFNGATNFNQNIGGWNVSKVNDMDYMFKGAVNFNQNIGGWNVSIVESMYGMFDGATNFNQDISGWNVSKVGYMQEMFRGASQFNQNLANWCVTKILSKPSSFDANTTAWTPKTGRQPVWGTCPGG